MKVIGQRRALVIAATQSDLRGVEPDAHRIAAMLRERAFLVALCSGRDASREGMREALRRLVESTRSEDALVVYYAGHGGRAINTDPRAGDPRYPEVARSMRFLVPSDYHAGSGQFLGITMQELSIALAALTARTDNVTMIFDCCHAADMTRARADLVRARGLAQRPRVELTRELDALEAHDPGIALDAVANPRAIRFFACGEDEMAWERDRADGSCGGVFTDALLDALASGASTTWHTLAHAVRERVHAQVASQRPALGGPLTRALFELESPSSAPWPGIIKRLKEHGTPFLAVAVKSRDEEIAIWEERAWARRKEHQKPIFVAGLEDTMKEASRMLQPSWWQNFAERAHVASELAGSSPTRGRVVRSAGDQRVIRDALPGKDVTLVVGDIGLGPKVDVGGQVASRGITPTTGVYTAFDAQGARKLVSDLSKGDNHFAFARLSDDGSAPILDVPALGKGTRPLGMPEIATGGGNGGGGNGGGRKPPRRLVVFEAMDGESSRQLAHDLRTPDDHDVPTWQHLATDSLLSTVNPERAARNLKLIEKQEPGRIASVQVVRGANLESLLPTPARGDHALTVVLLARNVEEFRASVTKASRAGLLEGKHIALITCGDASQATAELREAILNGGAAMVWTPERQLSEGLGEALVGETHRTVAGLPEDHTHTTVDTIMRTTIDRMKRPGGHIEASLLDESRTWVMLFLDRRRDWLRGLG